MIAQLMESAADRELLSDYKFQFHSNISKLSFKLMSHLSNSNFFNS